MSKGRLQQDGESSKSRAEPPLRATAEYYTTLGWHILPLHTASADGVCSCGAEKCPSAGKHPRTSHGLLEATTDTAVLDAWWTGHPNSNIGIRTGVESKLLVLDIDPRHGGDETLADLERRHGKLPDTVEVITGGGGQHLYFKHPGGHVRSRSDALGPGIDVKADGGYVAAPPSRHASGTYYAWDPDAHPERCQPDELPAWAFELVSGQSPADAADAADGKRIASGTRNNTLASLAGTMRRRGMSAAEIDAALQVVNERCDPPLDAGEVTKIATSVARYPAAEPDPEVKLPAKDEKQSEILVGSCEDADLFHDARGEGYAVVHVGDHEETWKIRSNNFKRWLVREFFRLKGKPPSAQAISDALCLLEAQAQFDGPLQEAPVRIGGDEGKIFVDLCDEAWRCVEVTPGGVRILDSSPIHFTRAPGMGPLPAPTGRGNLESLRPFLNVGSDNDWRLAVAWITAAIRPAGPYPVLGLHGEQGSAKSTTARVLRSCVDPSAAPLRSGPREGRDLMISAANSWVLCFDNLSKLPVWLSDGLCRLATGGGFSTRQLYTDGDEVIIDAQRPIILNGIEELAERGDLTERSLLLDLPEIERTARKPEATFWRDFEAAHGGIFTALLQAVSAAQNELPSVEVDELPRMADFALWGVALERALRWPPDSFLNAYNQNLASANQQTLEASNMASVIMKFAQSKAWTGTFTDLLSALTDTVSEDAVREKWWPKTPSALSGTLKRLAPNLRKAGISIHSERRGHDRRRRVTIRESRRTPSAPSAPASAGARATSAVNRSEKDTSERADGADGADGLFPASHQKEIDPDGEMVEIVL